MTMIVLPWPPASLSGHAKGHRPWTIADVDLLRASYGQGDNPNVAGIAAALGRSKAAVRNQACKLGITVRDDSWTSEGLEVLRTAYAADSRPGAVGELPARLGRTRSGISTKAAQLGLTDPARPKSNRPRKARKPPKFANAAERSAALSRRMIERHGEVPHPMLGKTHSPETRARIGEKAAASWRALSKDEKGARVVHNMKAAIAKNGHVGPNAPGQRGTWKAGWREVGDKRNYYRSRWEANYGRYLQWLKGRGEITDWLHEPETFWFEGIKRGVRSYLPDFRVFENDGSSKLHEVKGWMDARSKTTLRRMAKYHPAETIILIRERDYNSIARQLGPLIEGWESSSRSDRP